MFSNPSREVHTPSRRSRPSIPRRARGRACPRPQAQHPRQWPRRVANDVHRTTPLVVLVDLYLYSCTCLSCSLWLCARVLLCVYVSVYVCVRPSVRLPVSLFCVGIPTPEGRAGSRKLYLAHHALLSRVPWHQLRGTLAAGSSSAAFLG